MGSIPAPLSLTLNSTHLVLQMGSDIHDSGAWIRMMLDCIAGSSCAIRFRAAHAQCGRVESPPVHLLQSRAAPVTRQWFGWSEAISTISGAWRLRPVRRVGKQAIQQHLHAFDPASPVLRDAPAKTAAAIRSVSSETQRARLDGAQRGLEVMRSDIGKLVQLAIAALQFGGGAPRTRCSSVVSSSYNCRSVCL